MNAAGLSSTAPDTRLHAVLERGLAQARAREATAPTAEAAPEPVEPPPPATPRSLGLASDRACVESNLARKGLWRSGTGAGGGELVRLLDATDQLGMVQRIDAGPPLGALAFDVIVWACSRWRELGEAGERHVAFTLEAMAADLGWRKGGGAAAELARALDTLRSATFRARVYNARLGETRIDTFGLIDRWERGEPDRSGRPARAGFLVLGDWLHEQLARRHVTFVSWAELRALSSGAARRVLVYLEAERFPGPTWRRTIDDTLLTTLGIVAAKPFHQRATLRRAAEEVVRADNRYVSVSVEPGDHRGVYVLAARRRDRKSDTA
jgi:Replication initiator protein A